MQATGRGVAAPRGPCSVHIHELNARLAEYWGKGMGQLEPSPITHKTRREMEASMSVGPTGEEGGYFYKYEAEGGGGGRRRAGRSDGMPTDA
jgi:hypothetical protein